LKPAWRRRARWALLRSQRRRTVAAACRAACTSASRRLGRRLAGLPGVEGVFVRHTAPSSPAFVVGHSDLDLTVLLDAASVEDPRRVAACTAAVSEAAGGPYFFVQPQDLRFSSRAELERLRRRLPAPPELLYRVDDWAPLAGGRPRLPGPADARESDTIRHPEFNKWWDTMLQLQVLDDAPDLERGYARSLFRCALKSHLILETGAGRPPDPRVLLRDDLARADFRANPELGAILRRLALDGFWTRQPRRIAVRVLHLSLRAAAAFYRARPAPSGDAFGGGAPRRAAAAADESAALSVHRAVTGELRERVARAAPRLPGLRSAAAFPLPHCAPPAYRLELVLEDDLDPRDLVRVVDGVRQGLGGRAFDAAGAGVEVALLPETVHAHPLYRSASASPFLVEHVRARAVSVFGPAEESAGADLPAAGARGAAAPRTSRDVAPAVEWFRTWLPFHAFNLRRRPGQASRVLNFTQLASARLFLEAGEVATDAGRVRRLYLERFGSGDPRREALERLLRSFGGGGAEVPGEFARLSEEYDRLEALVGG
jgi:hypothetical protein